MREHDCEAPKLPGLNHSNIPSAPVTDRWSEPIRTTGLTLSIIHFNMGDLARMTARALEASDLAIGFVSNFACELPSEVSIDSVTTPPLSAVFPVFGAERRL